MKKKAAVFIDAANVIYSKGHVSFELLKAADKYINFNTLREFVERVG